MARKTMKQMAEEAALEREVQNAHDFAQYPSRLMAALELATRTNNYELSVENRMFALKIRDYPRDPALYFTLTHTPDSQLALENLEWEMKAMAEQQAELERQRLAREAALAKLTKEERELLNL